MKRQLINWFITIIFIEVSFFYAFFYLIALQNVPLSWDEVDYANAVRQGVAANIKEKGSMHLTEFYQFSKAKKNHDVAALHKLAEKLPAEKKDPFNLRHLHPPTPILYWSAFTKLIGGNLTFAYRMSNILLAWLVVVTIFLSLWIAGKTKSSHLFYAGVLSVLLFSSFVVLQAFSLINFHTFHLIACILFCGIWIRFLENPEKKNEALLGFGLSFLFCTLEMSFVIFGAALLSLLLSEKRKILLNFKMLFRVIAWFFGFLLILWPGAFLTGGPIKSFANYFYRIFLYNNDEYLKVNYLQNWIDLFLNNPFYFVFILLALSILVFQFKKINPVIKTILIIGALYSFAITPFMLNTSYIVPGLGIIGFGALMLLADVTKANSYLWISKSLQPFSLFLCLTSLTVFYFQTDFDQRENKMDKIGQNERSDLKEISSFVSEGKILSNAADICSFYAPEGRFVSLEPMSKVDPGFNIREKYIYRSLKTELADKKYSAIVILKYINYTSKKLKTLEDLGYVRKDLNTHIHFYLPR